MIRGRTGGTRAGWCWELGIAISFGSFPTGLDPDRNRGLRLRSHADSTTSNRDSAVAHGHTNGADCRRNPVADDGFGHADSTTGNRNSTPPYGDGCCYTSGAFCNRRAATAHCNANGAAFD